MSGVFLRCLQYNTFVIYVESNRNALIVNTVTIKLKGLFGEKAKEVFNLKVSISSSIPNSIYWRFDEI